jgi:hypothetical protein
LETRLREALRIFNKKTVNDKTTWDGQI